MTSSITFQDVFSLGPIAIVFAFSLLILIVESIRRKTETLNAWLSLAGFSAAVVAAVLTLGGAGTAFDGSVLTGGYASYFAVLFGTAGLLSVLLSIGYLRKGELVHSEYYVLLLIAVVGMMVMAASGDLVVFFLGLETMSIAFYVLAGLARKSLASNEAALKYFLLGAFATGFLLYGIALVYGASGTTALDPIRAQVPQLMSSPMFVLGLGLLLIGFAFKVAAVPFHMWVPDVYEGSPTTVSGFMSTGGKAAAFSIVLLVFGPGVLRQAGALREAIAIVAALSMVVGNLVAISQTSIKRMLAYSSIAHAGYILVGIAAANSLGANGVMFYLLAYTFMNLGAFGVISVLETHGTHNIQLNELSGISSRQPFLSALMALFMFSLAGIPPFAGFLGKYYVFAGAIEAGYTWLAILGVLMSVVSAFFYLRLVVFMYFREEDTVREIHIPALSLLALLLCAFFSIELGIVPSTVLDVTSRFF